MKPPDFLDDLLHERNGSRAVLIAVAMAAADVAHDDDLSADGDAKDARARLQSLYDDLPIDTRLKLEDAVLARLSAEWETGVLLGYALARTWPDSLSELARWPERIVACARSL